MAQRPKKSRLYPWYDSIWLDRYSHAKAFIQRHKPQKLNEFVDAFRVLHTRGDFEVVHLAKLFDEPRLRELLDVVQSIKPTDYELHEANQFRRFVVHDHPHFTAMQRTLEAIVANAVGEPVDSSYNFLSLYSALGVCPVHMDSPQAKWTLDVCLRQDEVWPIYVSDVQQWPTVDPCDDTACRQGDDWQSAIRSDPRLRFRPHTMQPGDALIFSGSSQWHYRDAMQSENRSATCDLLFFHFVPRGCAELVDTRNWPAMFDMPELGDVLFSAPLEATNVASLAGSEG